MSEQQSAAERLDSSLALLWRTREQPSRGRPPSLTVDQIVETAIEVADADGVDAISMRNIAERLGVRAMALYRYVPGKTELLNLMLDHVHAVDDTSETPSDWRTAAERYARRSWRRYLAHPWLLQLNWSRPVLGPHMVADYEAGLSALSGLGVTDVERVVVNQVVDGYVTGMARNFVQRQVAPQASGLDDAEFWRRQAPALAKAFAAGHYPTVAALPDEARATNWERDFEFGLQRILDGLDDYARAN